jgi:uncharacterized protein (TIGR00288 family)
MIDEPGFRGDDPTMSKSDRERERNLAVFIDLENLAMGFQNQRKTRFDIQKVLERLVEKGKLIVKKAYADWGRYQAYTTPFHEAAIELIEIPRRSQTGKNSADIRLVVDAMDLSWSKAHVDTFVIVSGDSDFSPLASKLKENGKHVIGLGMKGSTSELLRDNCDEFIYYEDLERQEEDDQKIVTTLQGDLTERQKEAFTLLIEACAALRRENHEVLYASLLKDTIKRKKPSFDESYYGYRSFNHLLEDADDNLIVEIEKNPKSGTYVVTRFGQNDESPPRGPRIGGSRSGGSRGSRGGIGSAPGRSRGPGAEPVANSTSAAASSLNPTVPVSAAAVHSSSSVHAASPVHSSSSAHSSSHAHGSTSTVAGGSGNVSSGVVSGSLITNLAASIAAPGPQQASAAVLTGPPAVAPPRGESRSRRRRR